MRWRRCISVLAAGVLLTQTAHGGTGTSRKQWRWYLGDPGRTHYSTLSQITPKNVGELKEAWVYHSGGSAQIQCNPLMVDGVLYGVSAERRIFALDAATGKELWTFTAPDEQASKSVLRGIQYWESGRDKRLMVAIGHHVYALNARTGALVEPFGEHGAIDLKSFYERDVRELSVSVTSPGVIYRNVMVMSVRVSEALPAAPGDIMAFDVRDGKKVWEFHTIPHPGEAGYETWPPDAWRRAGGANCWAGMALDEKRGIVYIPTGSASYDFYGANRKGANLYADCLLALDAATGKHVWHFQTVHHDLWDRDLPAPPTLVTVTREGKRRDAVAQTTKSGFVYVFDRATGESLFPIEERAVPASDIPGEEAWPTQPFPLKPAPFARQKFTEDLVTDRTPAAHAAVLDKLRQTRASGQFVPPSLDGTMIFPGFDGGAEWGGAAVNPKTGVLYVNATEMAWIVALFELTDKVGGGDAAIGKRVYEENCALCHGVDLKGDAQGLFPPMRDLQKKYSNAQMADIIRLGKDRMPGFEYLKGPEVDAVVKYICALESASERGAPDPVAAAQQPKERWFNHGGYNRFVDPDGFPAVKPPWGTLSAIDLNTGEYKWQKPLGESPESGLANTGTENYGGPVVTAGGLVFIAATKDSRFRAFDERSGAVVWEATLPAAGFATPCTYEVAGRQYVVIAAGGGKLGVATGDAYVAYALPEKR